MSLDPESVYSHTLERVRFFATQCVNSSTRKQVSAHEGCRCRVPEGRGGKTTLTTSLAVAAERAGETAAIIDLDPQATSTKWSDRRQGRSETPVVVSAQAARLAHVLKAAGESGAELVFIDTPPIASEVALAAVRAADLVLMPCRPSVFDLDAVTTTRDLVMTSGKPPIAVLNGVPPTGPVRAQAETVLREDLGLAVCPAAFGNRSAFSNAPALGMTAQEYDPKGKAAAEIEEVYQFVSKLLNSETSKGVKSNGSQTRRLAIGNAK